MSEKILTNYQIYILKIIINDSVKTISYHHPEKNLGKIVEGKSHKETLGALDSLEKDFWTLDFDPKLKFGLFDRCGWRVLDGAKTLYDSYAEEKKE